jgi:hypothetical protein
MKVGKLIALWSAALNWVNEALSAPNVVAIDI